MNNAAYFPINAEFMPQEVSVLVVYDQDEPVGGVERIFQSCGIKYQRVRSCLEAREVLRGPTPPRVVLTDLALPDGDWLDILRAANPAPANTPVIVASRVLDIKLYLDVLDRGAHDFVVPPFSSSDLAYIIRTAIQTDGSFPPQSRDRDRTPVEKSRIGKTSSMETIELLHPQYKEKIP